MAVTHDYNPFEPQQTTFSTLRVAINSRGTMRNIAVGGPASGRARQEVVGPA